jgi:hypothetical protein
MGQPTVACFVNKDQQGRALDRLLPDRLVVGRPPHSCRGVFALRTKASSGLIDFM